MSLSRVGISLLKLLALMSLVTLDLNFDSSPYIPTSFI